MLAADATATASPLVVAGVEALHDRGSRARPLAALAVAVTPSVLLAVAAVGASEAAGRGRGSRRAAARCGSGMVTAGVLLHTLVCLRVLGDRGSPIRGWASLSLVAGIDATVLYLRQLLPEARRER